MVNIGLAFPGRRVGGGTRGECSARKIMHLVPESNIAFQNELGHFALIIGPSNDPKDININFKEFEETQKNKIDLNDFKIKASKEKVFLISIPSQEVPLFWSLHLIVMIILIWVLTSILYKIVHHLLKL